MSFPFSYPISIPRGLTLTFRKTAFIWIITNLFFSKNQSCKDPIRGPQLLNSAVIQPVLLLMLLQHQEFEGWKRQATGYLLQVVFGVLAILSKKTTAPTLLVGNLVEWGELAVLYFRTLFRWFYFRNICTRSWWLHTCPSQ